MRGRKPGFYVYQFKDSSGAIIYVGKGSGRRLAHQERRFGCVGEVVREFATEKAAYTYEAKLIQRTAPRLNKAKGGGGAVARASKRLPLWWRKSIKNIEAVGPRIWVARELLKLDLARYLSPEQIAAVRAVSALK